MEQKEVADIIGVDVFTILNWEKNHSQPAIRSIPKITEFLGYCPAEPRTNDVERFKAIRTYLYGISQEEMAKLLGMDEGTVQRFERGERKRGWNLYRQHWARFLQVNIEED